MKQFNMVLRRSTKAFFGGALMLMSTVFAFKANAQTAISSTLTIVNASFLQTTNTCVVGQIGNTWTSNTGYWDYQLSTTGFTGISMSFTNQRSSTGPNAANVFYNIGGSDVFITSFAPPTTCPTSPMVINLPVACEGVANLHIKVKLTGATGTSGTHRMPTQVFSGTTSLCTGTPTAGTVSSSANPICAGTPTTLTLSGASSGGGITYQWQSSPDNATWTNLAGATGTTLTTPNLTASVYYRVVVTCPNSGLSANTSSLLETVNSVAFGAITGLNSTLMTVGIADTIATTPAGGIWTSSNTSRATIDASTGIISANAGGDVTFTYSVFDPTSGCSGTTDTSVAIIWPNTLALYAGDNGTSTGVITVANEGAGNLVATGFGTAATCSSGGFSGITVPTTVTSFNPANPHIGYTIYAAAGHKLNLSRIHAVTRESGTGPTQAIIAYRLAGSSTWNTEAAATTQNVGGSCGAASTSWDFAPSLLAMAQDSIEIAVFPMSPASSAGTFQLNSLEAYGIVSDDVACSGLSHPGALEAPTKWVICDSGSRFLNYNMLGAGVGITLTWQHAGPSGVFSDIVPADNTAAYNTGVLHAVNPADTFNIYRVRVTCSGTDAFSAPDTILVHGRTTVGTIVSSPNVMFPAFLHTGDNSNLTVSPAGSLTFWTSNDSIAVAVDSALGVVTGGNPGFAFITAHTTSDGVCFSTVTDSIRNILPQSVAVYVGQSGNSTATVGVAGITSVSPVVVSSGFGTTTSCTFGGVSGMVLPAGITAYNSSNPYVSMVVKAPIGSAGFEVDGIFATLRTSNSGPHFARIVYSINGGAFQTDGIDQSVDVDDCGKSHSIASYGFVTNPTLNGGDSIEIRVYPFYGVGDPTGGSFQVNSFDVISGTAATTLQKVPVAVAGGTQDESIKLFPNPATDVLNVVATETVNVTILGADGRKLIEQKGAKQINVSGLASGMYLVQVTDAKGNLIETTKFIKK